MLLPKGATQPEWVDPPSSSSEEEGSVSDGPSSPYSGFSFLRFSAHRSSWTGLQAFQLDIQRIPCRTQSQLITSGRGSSISPYLSGVRIVPSNGLPIQPPPFFHCQPLVCNRPGRPAQFRSTSDRFSCRCVLLALLTCC